MTMTNKTPRKTRKLRYAKTKIAESIRKHDDVNVRLMADCLETAFRHAQRGDLVRAMANLRNAAMWEDMIPTNTKLEIYKNG